MILFFTIFSLDFDFGMVGEALFQPEIALQNIIHGADNEGDYRFRCVIYSALFPQIGVVSGKKGFVEVYHRVFAAGSAAPLFEDSVHIGAVQKFRQIVHRPGYPRVQFKPGDVMEQLPQERIGLRQVIGGVAAVEFQTLIMVTARSEQAIAYRLRIHIGEFIYGQIMKKRLTETFQIGMQASFLRLTAKRIFD